MIVEDEAVHDEPDGPRGGGHSSSSWSGTTSSSSATTGRGEINVVYRRNDGTYGLIEPELGRCRSSGAANRSTSGSPARAA